MVILSKVINRFSVILIKVLIPITTLILKKWKAVPRIHVEMQGTPTSQNNLKEKGKQIWMTHPSQSQNFLQIHSNQNSVLLSLKDRHI